MKGRFGSLAVIRYMRFQISGLSQQIMGFFVLPHVGSNERTNRDDLIAVGTGDIEHPACQSGSYPMAG